MHHTHRAVPLSVLGFVFSTLLLTVPALASAASAPTFAPQIQTPAGGGPEWFAVADFNGDTFSDFAVADVSSNQISTALGNGNGTFGSLTTYPASQPHAVAAGDLNGDNKIDLVTADTSETLKVLLGNGTGTFVLQGATYPIAGSGDHVILADVNNDLKLDAIVVHQLSSTVSILLGNGDGTFATQQSYAAGGGPGQVSAGDLNGDNKLDLAITDNGSSGMVTLLGNGDGSFQSPTFYPIGTAFSTAIGDLNGDNKADLAVGTPVGVGVMLGNGDGTFQALTDYAADSGQHQVAIGDLNGDNVPDVAASNSVSNTLSVLVGNGDGTFQPQISFASAFNAFAIVLADFNNDGKKDVAITGVDGGVLSVHINTTPSTVAYYRFETGPNGAAISSVIDSSGNGNNGAVLTGAPTYNSSIPITPIPQTGAPNTLSGNFGDSDGASFAYPFPFNTNTNATLEFWIKPTSGTDSGDFLWGTTSGGDTNRFHLSWGSNDEVCGDYREPGGPAHAIGCTGVGTVPDGQWSFVAIVKQGNTYKMYVNNAGTSNTTVLKNTLTDVSPNLPNSTGWTINGRCVTEPNCGPGSQLSGLFDEIRLSNQALTPSQFLMLDQPTGVVTALAPAKVWVGLKNSDDVGTKFDLKAEAYNGATLIASGATTSVLGGSSGFNNARLDAIPLSVVGSPTLPSGSTLNFKVYVRNACVGPTHNSGTARLWYDGADANSQFGITVDSASSTNYLRNAFALSTSAGTSKKSIDVAAGAPCSAYKLFGTWSRVMP